MMTPSSVNGDVPTLTSGGNLPVFVPKQHNSRSPHVIEYNCEKGSKTPIAIIGYSLRFPQEATSSEAFWQMLVEGRSARTEIPGDRFNVDAFHHPDSNRHDSVCNSLFSF